jgi:putative membrane protein
MTAAKRDGRFALALLAVTGALFVWSGVRPHDRFTWFMEVFPVVIVVPVLLFTWRRFRLTRLLYVLIALHCIILMVGGKYTYALVPLGFWMEGWFGFVRNHYDRIGHFAQGFVPAIAAREILLRIPRLPRGAWLNGIVVACCLAISALYELLEWAVAAATGEAAEAFLGTQGDVWDTQKDMLLALIGASCALLLLSRLHDRQLERVAGRLV